MIIWGAIWGGILGVFVSSWGELQWIVGASMGALAGWTLRRAVRHEVARLTKPQAVPSTLEQSATQVTSASNDAPLETPTAGLEMPLSNLSVSGATSAATAMGPGEQRDTLVAEAQQPPHATLVATSVVGVAVKQAKDWLLGGNTVARVGTIVLFIGLSFLAKWAVDNSLFPPELRLAGIGVVGIALLVQGFRLARANPDGTVRSSYALLLQGTGVAVLYLTVFAACKLYAMIPPFAAFALMALVCALSTLIAILANAQPLAFVGFAGAFATPILLSTGQGSHVVLFSFYLLLNIAIGLVAWLRAWRALNLLGFVSTFLVAAIWIALKYTPQHYATTQPFLIAFFAVYVVIGLLSALRHSPQNPGASGHTLDGVLIFGTAIVTFALQTQLVTHVEYGAAISAVLLSAVYTVLAFSMRERAHSVARWLVLSYAALSLIFATLAVPLAVDGRLTAAIWAIEGAGVFWLAMKQKRWMGQVFGAAMQLLAALAFASTYEYHIVSDHPFLNSHFIGTLMLALGSFSVSWWAFTSSSEHHNPKAEANNKETNDTTLIASGSVVFFLIGFAWTLFGIWFEVLSSALVLKDVTRFGWFTFSFVLLTFCAFLIGRRTKWRGAYCPVVVVLPFLLACAALYVFALADASLYFDALLWPACFALHLIMLRGVDSFAPRWWWRIVHAGNALLGILLIGGVLYRLATSGEIRHTDWSAVILLLACTLAMMALASQRVWAESATGWPLGRFQREYALHAGLGVAVLTIVGGLIVAVLASGNTTPLPYVPLLNPVDLVACLAVVSVALWLKRLRAARWLSRPSRLDGRLPTGVLALASFIVVNTAWLRFAHHFRKIPWDASALAGSFFVQAGYSMLWTLLGVGAMVWAHKKGQRVVWQVGAALLALTVVKLLVVDLANSGGGERIVAFIGVGILMVAVGYFAPMPPGLEAKTDTRRTEASHEAD